MSGERTDTVTESIEHLDFAPKCEAISNGCSGTNQATYLAVYRTPCCVPFFYIYSPCVERKITLPRLPWVCTTCRRRTAGSVSWLEVVTLHSLGGASC